MHKKILFSFLAIFTALLGFSQTQTTGPGDWNNPGIWSAGVPNSTTDAVVRHAVTIDADSDCQSLNVVSPSGAVTNSAYKLLIWGDLVVSNPSQWIESGTGYTQLYGTSSSISGKIVFENFRIRKNRKNGPHIVTANDSIFVRNFFSVHTGTLDVTANAVVLLDDGGVTSNARLGYSPKGFITGNIVWQNYVDRCNEWSTYSAPFDVSLADIAANTDEGSGRRMIYTGFPDSDYPSFHMINAYFYDESTGYTAPTSPTNNLSGGKGYWYWNSDAVYYSPGVSIPQQWTWEVTGNGFNSGDYTFDVTFDNDGMNLVGNPYPGMLDWDHGSWTRSNIDDAIYYWNTCTQSYASYVGGVGSNGGSQWIPAGQGFWVEATAAGPSMQVRSSALPFSQWSDQPLLKESGEEPAIKIFLNGDETLLMLDENASQDYDKGLDAKKLIAPHFVNDLSAVKTVFNGVNYSVNTIPFEDALIPLDVKGEGQLYFEGADLFEELDIYLEDKITGDVVDMKLQQSYYFNNDATNFTDRFNIIINKKSLVAVEEMKNDNISIYPNPVNDRLNITSINDFDRVEVFNALGKLVVSKTSMSNIMSVDMTELNSGVYIVKVYNGADEVASVMTQKM